jgi:4-carboxymuconolactone decarboxylase
VPGILQERDVDNIDARTRKGIALASGMLGQQFGEKITAHIESGEFGADLARHGMAHSYTDSWGRDGLDRRSRSLVTIGALIALRQPNELKNHIRAGVANGLVDREFEEILVQLSTYVGYPAVSSAMTVIVEVLRELGRADIKTAEERGVL